MTPGSSPSSRRSRSLPISSHSLQDHSSHETLDLEVECGQSLAWWMLGAYEFAETEQFIATAEAICGPYVWGRYDILLLPPSFPYGGMENPCLTFVTPTLLAGDRSLANVVAHEIAHSWMGNLVTNMTWEHFWMNGKSALHTSLLITFCKHWSHHLHYFP